MILLNSTKKNKRKFKSNIHNFFYLIVFSLLIFFLFFSNNSRDPAFAVNIKKFFGIDDEIRKLEPKRKEKSMPKYKTNNEEEKDVVVLQKEIADTEERLRNLYLKHDVGNMEIKLKVPKKINPTYLSYAGSEISYGIQNDPKKYEVDVIGNINRKKEEFDKTYHTIDGIKRFGAGLKNLNSKTTMNPIPIKYTNQFHLN